jgi:hypothetical protein
MSGNKKPSGEVRGGFGFHQPWPMFWTYPSMQPQPSSTGWAVVAI